MATQLLYVLERQYIPSGRDKAEKVEPVIPPKTHPPVEGPVAVIAVS